jgi:hypothetical protein
MILERESVSGHRRAKPARALASTLRGAGRALVLGAWLAATLAVQSKVGADLARSLHDDEERLELRIRGRHDPPANVAAPPRTNEEAIDPWELVSV